MFWFPMAACDQCMEFEMATQDTPPLLAHHAKRMSPELTRIAALSLAGLVAATASHANDGFGALGVGGIIVGHTEQIALTHESLSISESEIEVYYEFVNRTDRDITTTISFPLPPYTAFSWGMAPPNAVPPNFQIDVFGSAAQGIAHPSFATRVWAVTNGTDITARLAALGFTQKDIALMPFDEITNDHPYLKRSAAVIAALRKAGWVNKDNLPIWDVHVAYEWQMTFPAHKPLHIRHFYQPLSSSGTASGYAGPTDAQFGDAWLRREFCATDDVVNRMHALFAQKSDLDPYNEVPGTGVDYVLKTGNTWKDGIEDFDLKVSPQSPYESVAFCLKGTHAPESVASGTGSNRRDIVRHYKNFRPATDLKILFTNSWTGQKFWSVERPTITSHSDLK